MTVRKSCTRSARSPHVRGERIKDEVYRQMFRLEEGRAGSETSLAVALLRAWLTADSQPADAEEHDWLKKISPICIEMIEAAMHAGGAAGSCSQ
jgi:hypothetical protein